MRDPKVGTREQQRAAKRYVCRILVTLLEGEIANGSAWIYQSNDRRLEPIHIDDAIRELVDEMQRRGGN